MNNWKDILYVSFYWLKMNCYMVAI
jgi:hypothetical protein